MRGSLRQALAVDVAHRDVVEAAVAAGLVHGADARVIQTRRDLGLASETAHGRRVGPGFEAEHLEGHGPLEALVGREVHDSLTAATELALDPVVCDAVDAELPWRRGGIGVGRGRDDLLVASNDRVAELREVALVLRERPELSGAPIAYGLHQEVEQAVVVGGSHDPSSMRVDQCSAWTWVGRATTAGSVPVSDALLADDPRAAAVWRGTLLDYAPMDPPPHSSDVERTAAWMAEARRVLAYGGFDGVGASAVVRQRRHTPTPVRGRRCRLRDHRQPRAALHRLGERLGSGAARLPVSRDRGCVA